MCMCECAFVYYFYNKPLITFETKFLKNKWLKFFLKMNVWVLLGNFKKYFGPFSQIA